MKRIQFSELVNRQRRNLMGASFLMIGVVYFEIEIKDGALLGLTLENFNTQTALTGLLVFLLYHLLVFCVGAYEEYGHWRLTFANKEAAAWGGISTIDFASKLRLSADAMDNLFERWANQPPELEITISEDDADKMREASEAVLQFQRAVRNFPVVTSVRFWALDVGLAITAASIAIGFYFFSLSRYTS